MKRKITDLEQRLLNDGWRLLRKVYKGKHSEKIDSYEYSKLFNNLPSFIQLNATREKVKDFWFATYETCIDYTVLGKLTSQLRELFNYVESIDNPQEQRG